jgi:hypothetical protein
LRNKVDPAFNGVACEAVKQFFDEGPPPRDMDALTVIFPKLRNKTKTSPVTGFSVD